MSQTNTKWAKLYTQADCQMIVTITPSEDGGWVVEQQMMVNGDLHIEVAFEGGNEDTARNEFDKITRDDVNVMLKGILDGGTASEAPAEEVEEKEEVDASPESPVEEDDKKEEGNPGVTLENLKPENKGGILHVTLVDEEYSEFLWDGEKLFASTEMEEDIYDEYKERLFLRIAEAVPGTEGAEENPMSEEEIQAAYDALTKAQLKGWTSCMQKKIVSHYGAPVEDCVKGITHGNWEKILECIVTVLGITDPEVWIPEQIVLFTGWSVECIFGATSKKD